MNKKPFIERLKKAYDASLISDGEVLDLVYARVDKILKEVDEYMDGDDTPLTTVEVERLALIIRFKIDVNQGNISVEDMEKALDEHSLNSTIH